nr:Uncharacterised protein [Raoultella sp. NCTC 9187]
MKMIRTPLTGFRPLLLAVALAAAVAPAYAAVPKDMLVIGKAGRPADPRSAVTIDNNDWTVTYPAYQRLVKYKTDDGKARRTSRASWRRAGRSPMTVKPGPLRCTKACSLPTARR